MLGDTLILEAVAGRVISAHLIPTGRTLIAFRNALRRLFEEHPSLERLSKIKITNDGYAAGRMADTKLIVLKDDDGVVLDVPPMLVTLAYDGDRYWTCHITAMALGHAATLVETKSGVGIALGESLPQTVIAGIGGEPLRRFVSHSVLDQMDLRISGASDSGGTIMLGGMRDTGTQIALRPAGRFAIPLRD